MKANQIIVDLKTLGTPPYWLCDVTPDWEYINGERSNKQKGWTYSVALPERGLEKLPVKIPGERLVSEITDIKECTFTGLKVGIYTKNNQIMLKATATGISLVNEK